MATAAKAKNPPFQTGGKLIETDVISGGRCIMCIFRYCSGTAMYDECGEVAPVSNSLFVGHNQGNESYVTSNKHQL